MALIVPDNTYRVYELYEYDRYMLTNKQNNSLPVGNTTMPVEDRPIKGTAVYAQMEVPRIYSESLGDKDFLDHVRNQLCTQLVQEMKNLRLIEFTKTESISGVFTFRGRMFVVPNDQVQLLRIHGVIK